ncbi:MAG: alanyl-tRNA editing protein, partial [Acutalibacteraceae bacterium]
MTKRLFDLDSCIFEFNAEVISCEKQGDFFVTVLDKTAFFPEGGGQTGDTGYIGGTEISDTQEKDGIIYHYSKQPVEVSENAYCKVDFRSRFCKMQNHTGEHIISGLVHSIFGYDNVGFHLGRNDMTMDYNGELSENDIDELETLANRAVYDNIPVFAEYPDKNELKSISYRSKLDLKEKVRIVTIPGIDCCACCAPHVKSTGSVGIIKITDFMRYKGGTRLHARCGFDGLAVFKSYQKSAEEISSLNSRHSASLLRPLGALSFGPTGAASGSPSQVQCCTQLLTSRKTKSQDSKRKTPHIVGCFPFGIRQCPTLPGVRPWLLC